MSEDKIRVVLLEPNKMAKAAEIESSLEAMQRVVQGDIQAIYPFEEEVCIVCNEEGKINGMSLNRGIYDSDGSLVDIIAGPCFICDGSEEDFASLSDSLIEKYLEVFRYPEMFFNIDGKFTAIKIM